MNRFHSSPQNKTSPITHYLPEPPSLPTQCPPKSPSSSSPTPTTTTPSYGNASSTPPPPTATPSTPTPPVPPSPYANPLEPLPKSPYEGFVSPNILARPMPSHRRPFCTVIHSPTMPVNRPNGGNSSWRIMRC